MKNQNFDVFVLGSGTAGRTVAHSCAKAGLTVGISENRTLGGTCANRGCDPKKVLLGPTEIVQRVSDMLGKGIKSPVWLNFKKLQRFKKTFTKDIPEKTAQELEAQGIEIFQGSPKFLDKSTLVINNTEIQANKIVIATGKTPRELEIEGNEYLKSSDDFLLLEKIPKKIIFIGAGYIGMELAHLAARSGSKVTVMDEGDKPLQNFDKDLVHLLTESSKKLGISFIFNARITSVLKKTKKFKVKYTVDNSEKSKKAYAVYNTAGRVPSISWLDLEKANIDYGEKGVMVDQFLRSKTNKSVYACGDVSDHGLPLTPLAGIEGNLVAKNIIEGNKHKINIPLVPSVVFTIPNLAMVGYSEQEAGSRFKNITVKFEEISDWYNNKRINGDVYAYKIITNDRTDQIVGAHVLSPEAAETINIFTVAMNQNTTADDLKRTIFTYPSWGNDIKNMLAD